MVSGISEQVAVQEHFPKEMSIQSEHVPESTGPVHVDDVGNLVVVSKDFILGLLSLAVGKPGSLEGNLGKTVDVKV